MRGADRRKGANYGLKTGPVRQVVSQILAPCWGFFSTGHFAAHERNFGRNFKEIFSELYREFARSIAVLWRKRHRGSEVPRHCDSKFGGFLFRSSPCDPCRSIE